MLAYALGETALVGCKFRFSSKVLVVTLALSSSMSGAALAQQAGEAGASSPGSPGMEELGEPVFLQMLEKARRKGAKSQEYIGALVQLGMYYNRHGRNAEAAEVLRRALAIIDAGALKPSAQAPPVPPLVQQHSNGTVSATNMNPPKPYEETLENLLPALITAELGCNRMQLAETHIKRLIALSGSNEVTGKLNLMSAYSLYAQLLRRKGQMKQAQEYERKADEINRSFKPL